MKKIYKNLLMVSSVLVLTLFSTQILQGAEVQPQKNVIHVNGKATIKVKPNIAHINANVTTENKDAKKAQADNAKVIDVIKKEIIKTYNLEDEDVNTINYTVRPTYDYVEGKQIFRNYTVEHTLEITLNEIAKAGALVDTLVENGATSVSNIRFGIKDETQSYNLALQKALQDAEQKADALTTALGVKQAKPISITEQSDSQGSLQKENILMQDSVSSSSPGTTIEQSDIEVVAILQVTFQW